MNRYRINEVKLNIGEDIELLPERIAKKIGRSRQYGKSNQSTKQKSGSKASRSLKSNGHQIKLKASEIHDVQIVRRSIDSRKTSKNASVKNNSDAAWKNNSDAAWKYNSVAAWKNNSDVVGTKNTDAAGITNQNGEIRWVYTVDFSCDKKLDLPTPSDTTYEIPIVRDSAHRNATNTDHFEPSELPSHEKDFVLPEERPVVVGFGPCGMFCALVLARAGLSPIVIERGDDVDTRQSKVEEFWRTGKLDTESNVQFGEGGAGTFSDGKLNTGINDPRIRFVLETFVEAGADPDILIDGRPHIGTDALRSIVKSIREEIISLEGEVRFRTKLTGIDYDEVSIIPKEYSFKPMRVKGIHTLKDNEEAFLPTNNVVLALGHSARDTVRVLHAQGLKMEPKPFSMGVRVQHSQELIDRGTYGAHAGHPDLPPAYYKLSTKASDGHGVYSFCMCPGGEIVNAASQENGVVTNGMSNHDRDSGWANSGILVDVRPEDYIPEMTMNLEDAPPLNECTNPTCSIPHHDRGIPAELAGMAYQEYYEHLAFINGGSNYNLPTTTWSEYKEAIELRNETTSATSAGHGTAEAVIASLPEFVARDIAEAMPVFGRKIKGFDSEDTIIKAIESRSSSPVRIIRDRETMQSQLADETMQSQLTDETMQSHLADETMQSHLADETMQRYLADRNIGGHGEQGFPESHLPLIHGVYPGGEGAGYAGGITSAAVDGIKIAEVIIDKSCK